MNVGYSRERSAAAWAAPTRVLLLEDSEADAEAEKGALKTAGIDFVALRVDSEEGFERALNLFRPDIVLSDYRLSSFDSASTLRTMRTAHPKIPVIIVSSPLDKAHCADLQSIGALDCVFKDRLFRLGPLVKHAISNARQRRTHHRAQRELKFRNAILSTVLETTLDAVLVVDENGRVVSYNHRFIDLWGIPEAMVATGDDQPILAMVLAQVRRPEAFLARIRHLYANRAEESREEIHLRDHRIMDRYSSPMFGPDGTYHGRAWFFRDVTESKRTLAALANTNRVLKALCACNAALVHATSEDGLLREMCRVIVDDGGYRIAAIARVERGQGLAVQPIAEYTKNYDLGARGKGRNGPMATGPGSQTDLAPTATGLDTDDMPLGNDAIQLEYGSIVTLALGSSNGTFAALYIYSDQCSGFEQDEIDLLATLAADLAFGVASLRERIAHKKSAESLRLSMEKTIQAMAAALELRDAYTAGHQHRVADLAAAIAREMGLTESEIRGLYLAATIHDFGKIQVPAEILSKPGPLTEIEYALVKTHPGAAYGILKEIEFPWPIAQIVYQHHERLDGSGYPRGLKNHEILIEAKILAVADTVEAMASHRPYRPGLGIEAALDIVTGGKGTLYDAAAVDACVKLFRSKDFAFASDAAAIRSPTVW